MGRTGHEGVRPDVEVEHTLIYSVLDAKNVVEQTDIIKWYVPSPLTKPNLPVINWWEL